MHAQPTSAATATPVNNTSHATCCHCGWRGGGHAKDCPFDMDPPKEDKTTKE
ncbi:hypothetical protein BKA62DRAFT_710691 [Auriculariales sp. MPI-PUGE-AT-0066]|nr:hypothetical protein BKA62DRAFT_710678 [Auriculariales sp. MPI-PUGE-AT-0066]KAH7099176.1 hypothetical protein BKA62DRAFT_710691 [Auriculariales sp. MPI-PUGE-AT-0066]